MKKYFLILLSLIIFCTPAVVLLMEEKGKEKEKEDNEHVKQKKHIQKSKTSSLEPKEIKELDALIKDIDKQKLPVIDNINSAIEQLVKITFRYKPKGKIFPHQSLFYLLGLTKKLNQRSLPPETQPPEIPLSPEILHKISPEIAESPYYIYKHSRRAQIVTERILSFLQEMTDTEKKEALEALYNFNRDISNDIEHALSLGQVKEKIIFNVNKQTINNARFYNDNTLIVTTNDKLYFFNVEKQTIEKTLTFDDKTNTVVAFDWNKTTLAVCTYNDDDVSAICKLYNVDTLEQRNSNSLEQISVFSFLSLQILAYNKHFLLIHSKLLSLATSSKKIARSVIIEMNLKHLNKLLDSNSGHSIINAAIDKDNRLICDLLNLHFPKTKKEYLSPHLLLPMNNRQIISRYIDLTHSQFELKKDPNLSNAFTILHSNKKYELIGYLNTIKKRLTIKVNFSIASMYTPHIILQTIPTSAIASDVVAYGFNPSATQFFIATKENIYLYAVPLMQKEAEQETPKQKHVSLASSSSATQSSVPPPPVPLTWYQQWKQRVQQAPAWISRNKRWVAGGIAATGAAAGLGYLLYKKYHR